ncbi:MAG: hypothetical protein M3016_10975 [Actinomycetota bacterium]|nr:hypothetical protein [Actinomycetota bacterium]
MNPEQQLGYESSVRDRQAVVAAVAAVLLIAGTAIQLAGPKSRVAELTIELITDSRRVGFDLVAAALNAVAFIAIGWTVSYLSQCARARNPERVRSWVRIVALVGSVLAALATIVFAIVIAVQAHQFVTTGAQTYQQANALLASPIDSVLQVAALLGIFMLALGVVLTSLHAMQQGLLPKVMGYAGIFAGVLIVFPLSVLQIPVVQAGWLAGLAYLFSGRWPGGLPPAWITGQAQPWPSSAQMRAQRAAGAGPARAKPAPTASPQPAGAPAPGRTRATTSKRKRKRRH